MNAISVSDLSFVYEKLPVLEKVSLEVEKGEFIGIVGPNGGGKTTLFKLLMGFLAPTRGSVLLFGRNPSQSRQRIGYVPQIHRTDREFPITVRELVLLGALSERFSYSEAMKQRADSLMEELGLTPFANEPFSSLSGGYAQRALFARALLPDPELLFLDEPTANVDAATASAILDRLEKFKGTKTILLITHDLRTVVERVDRILCVERRVTSLYPREVCEHFALGLYHAPLLDHSHLNQGLHVPHCVFPR